MGFIFMGGDSSTTRCIRTDLIDPRYMCGAPNRSLLQTGPILENCERLESFALTRFTVFLAYFSGLPVYSTTSYKIGAWDRDDGEVRIRRLSG